MAEKESLGIEAHVLRLYRRPLAFLHRDSLEAEVQARVRHLLAHLDSLVDALELAGVDVLLLLLGGGGVVDDDFGQVVKHVLH